MRTSEGDIERASLVGKQSGHIQIQGEGPGLPLPYLPLGAGGEGPISVRLHRTDAPTCWGADFEHAEIKRNEEGQHRSEGRDLPGPLAGALRLSAKLSDA